MASKIVGVLGGMGPEATVDFMNRVIRNTPAKNDQEHIRMLVDNNPQVPDRTQAIVNNGREPGLVLGQMAQNLEKWGAELLAIPCNTAHYFLNDVKNAVNIPVIDMIEKTGDTLVQDKVERIALLATNGTLKTGLYNNKLQEHGIEIVLPTTSYQEKVMEIIYFIKSGEHQKMEPLKKEVIEHVKEQGASAVLLGCTELPLAFTGDEDYGVKFYETTDILAKAVVKAALG